MLIKSQYDKVFNLDNILFIDIVEEDDGTGTILIRLTNNETFVIGQYDSMHRAEEIQEQILESYSPMTEYAKGMSISQGIFINTMPKVYRLPKE